ncbi:ROK family transcriptional regulator [Pseudalkalibacillus salsuginis]|uniref:ROK family transcriptional regulator n=1 Tax=Pseudalkalibacillus salsuginis TaxID=2910972 RepID=UPI001F1C3F96|nr:ROK family transcriptional regulator [Pseudalkalibacillus salsuginis]MCF6409644.1 ROK family transcriptional regulator [Pseudalkalibacillus salsuginis]
MKTIKTGDQNLIKKINKSIVMKSIEQKGPISRAQISKDTGLNKATVSTMVSELLEESLVNEIGAGKSNGGRKPVLLYFNHKAVFSIGIDLGVNYILAILTDLRGDIVFEKLEKLEDKEPSIVIEKVIALIHDVLSHTPESPYGVIGIGIGVPGIVDTDGKILFAPNLQWKQIDLKQAIEEAVHIPVSIENEANTGCLGEQLYGAGKNISNLLYVSIGIGIGTGIIINGNLYTGATGISGEMGHHTIETNGKKCRCGNRGCWELYASESALLEEAMKLDVFKQDVTSNLDSITREAKNGNSEVIQLLNSIGEYVGIGLTNIINTFNPEMIIIGNRLAQFKTWITNPIHRTLEERLSPYSNKTTIEFASLDTYSSALGSSSIAKSNFFAQHKITVK